MLMFMFMMCLLCSVLWVVNMFIVGFGSWLVWVCVVVVLVWCYLIFVDFMGFVFDSMWLC